MYVIWIWLCKHNTQSTWLNVIVWLVGLWDGVDYTKYTCEKSMDQTFFYKVFLLTLGWISGHGHHHFFSPYERLINFWPNTARIFKIPPPRTHFLYTLVYDAIASFIYATAEYCWEDHRSWRGSQGVILLPGIFFLFFLFFSTFYHIVFSQSSNHTTMINYDICIHSGHCDAVVTIFAVSRIENAYLVFHLI